MQPGGMGKRCELQKTYCRAYWRPRNRIWWHQVSCFCCAKK